MQKYIQLVVSKHLIFTPKNKKKPLRIFYNFIGCYILHILEMLCLNLYFLACKIKLSHLYHFFHKSEMVRNRIEYVPRSQMNQAFRLQSKVQQVPGTHSEKSTAAALCKVLKEKSVHLLLIFALFLQRPRREIWYIKIVPRTPLQCVEASSIP